MKYDKPHLSYDQQLALMRDRGLAVADHPRAIQGLKRIGYYRLSGYTFPLRTLEENPQQAKGKQQKRGETFIEGASFEDAVALHDFDHRLRGILLDGLQQLEVGLRVKIGYTLGKRGALAHLDESELDPTAQNPHRRKRNKSRYEVWREEYDSLQEKAKNGKQEFVMHFTECYDDEVPIWAAVGFMTMGCLISLYNLLNKKDRRTIARSLRVKNSNVLVGWLNPLNILRNQCAHGNRVWNRPIPFQADKLNLEMLTNPALLRHLAISPKAPVDHRVYFHAATTAYLLRELTPDSTWPQDFVAVMRTFPSSVSEKFPLSPVASMGFIEGWEHEKLWKPAQNRIRHR